MYERGNVIKIDDDIVTISCGKGEQCKGCSASKLFCNVKTREFQALNDTSINLQNGDRVEIYAPPARTIGFSFSVLMFPLLMFFVGYYSAQRIMPASGEGLKIIGGFAGLAAGFFIAFLYNKLMKRRNLPIITSKIEE